MGLGAGPGLGVVHTGSAISFRLDIADLYKAEYTIPLAFYLAANGLTEERDVRLGLRDRIAETKLLSRVVQDVKVLLTPAGTDYEAPETSELCDERRDSVSAGVNWATHPMGPPTTRAGLGNSTSPAPAPDQPC
ncbi:hypothetical protein [Streptomyces spiramenti]|uniref:hypothetical protein n=1 Tax=Streptomyces spiramenti TaxID=2720606 RepID=UPI0030842C2D